MITDTLSITINTLSMITNSLDVIRSMTNIIDTLLIMKYLASDNKHPVGYHYNPVYAYYVKLKTV